MTSPADDLTEILLDLIEARTIFGDALDQDIQTDDGGIYQAAHEIRATLETISVRLATVRVTLQAEALGLASDTPPEILADALTEAGLHEMSAFLRSTTAPQE
ncbi:hypothetical protein AYO44_13285 [Planctomycetaceae bacterium SCGC AG-212-F19]|nr:hypothetical protein AYO44_13285 [Planctomycetaceae bacterium SCGC AG-212-F19]